MYFEKLVVGTPVVFSCIGNYVVAKRKGRGLLGSQGTQGKEKEVGRKETKTK